MGLGNRIMRLEEHGTAVGDHIFQHPYNEASEEEKDKLLDEAFLKLESAYKALDMRRNIRRALEMNPSPDELRIAQSMLNQQPAWLQASSMRFESRNPSIENIRLRMESEDNIFQRFWKWIKEFFSSLFGGGEKGGGGGGGGISSTVDTATDNVTASQQFVAAQKAEGKQRIYIESNSGVGSAFRDIFDFPDFKKSFEWLDSVNQQVKNIASNCVAVFKEIEKGDFDISMKLGEEDDKAYLDRLLGEVSGKIGSSLPSLETPYALSLKDEAIKKISSENLFDDPNKARVVAIEPFKVRLVGPKTDPDGKSGRIVISDKIAVVGGRKEFEPLYIDFQDWIGFATKLASVTKELEKSAKVVSDIFTVNPDTFFDSLITKLGEKLKESENKFTTQGDNGDSSKVREFIVKSLKFVLFADIKGRVVVSSKIIRDVTTELGALAKQMAAINAVEENEKADNQEKADREKELARNVDAKNIWLTFDGHGKETGEDKELKKVYGSAASSKNNEKLLYIAKNLSPEQAEHVFKRAIKKFNDREKSADKTKPSNNELMKELNNDIEETWKKAKAKAEEAK